ncbi:uncharacterized protein LOC117106809 isoform X2 [Anneissia japonica]|uniref:uncharacterized protein LOC117106809 isoform X2 n=1 Tax=Anneissia japonica TaxID=1529436 RepID=UPI0014255E77|nr:uncharacterized protein LOC117106809 isoform X2 [Anneissia japonica]
MLYYCLLITASLLCCTHSTHYRGGILGWRPAEDSNKVVIFWQVAWRRSYDDLTTYCSSRGEVKNGEGELSCQQCNPSLIYSPVEFECTDYNEIYDWSSGVGSLEYTYPIDKFTLVYSPGAEFSYWVPLQNYGPTTYWKMVSTVDMSVRSDIGRPNSLPVTSMIPVIKVQDGCTSTINIPASDPDGDVVRCRWADDNQNECPQAINGNQVCGPLSPNSYLNQDTCQITFNATGNPGWYAVFVIIEDFKTSTSIEPISKISLQFLINVFPLNDICRKPTIIAPVGSCEILRPNQFWQMSIRARTGRPSIEITQISTSTPPNVDKSFLARYPGSDTDYNVTLSWTPTMSELGQHFVCFFATDEDGVSTDQQCVTLVVTNEIIRSPPLLLPEQSVPNPRTPISAATDELILVFDSEIRKPELSSYVRIIKFRANGEERVISRYDTSRSNRVQFPEYNNTMLTINITGLNLRSERTYAIEVESGVVLGRYNDPCSVVRPNDGGRWFFATDEAPTTLAPTTTLLPTTTIATPAPITAPVAECTSFGLRVYVPRFIVGNVLPRHLHFNDPDCRGSYSNESVILMESSYDLCGTITKVKSNGIKYRNTIFSEPLPITNTSITREREIQINIVCDVYSDGIIHAVFDPDTSPIIFNMRETASFNFGLALYHDENFLVPYTMLDYPVHVLLRERLYFSAKAANSGLHLSIDSCKATPAAEPTAADYYYFILNGCVEDSTVEFHESPSLSEVRFSIESFEFHRHGMLDRVFISCDVNICSQNDINSVCNQGCTNTVSDEVQADMGDARRKRSSSAQLNTEKEHSERIALRFSSSKNKNTDDRRPDGFFDITVLVVNICLLVIVSIATVVGIKLARKLNRFSPRDAAARESNEHVQTISTKSDMKFDNQSYEIDI